MEPAVVVIVVMFSDKRSAQSGRMVAGWVCRRRFVDRVVRMRNIYNYRSIFFFFHAPGERLKEKLVVADGGRVVVCESSDFIDRQNKEKRR